jgi:hypothetical protein
MVLGLFLAVPALVVATWVQQPTAAEGVNITLQLPGEVRENPCTPAEFVALTHSTRLFGST